MGSINLLECIISAKLVRVFSCYSEDATGIEILIPKKSHEPVKILQDRDGRWEYHHD
jgi:hypothetical protein